jgi:hypothetical protein
VLRAGVWRVSGRRRWGTLSAVIGGYVIALALVIWGVAEIGGSTRVALLQGGVAIVMAIFIGVGAASERNSDRVVRWPADVTLAGLARSVVQLPAEAPVSLANQVAAGRAVILTGTDGLAVGLLDDAAAFQLARTQPHAPATLAARPITPEMVILADDQPSEVAERLRSASATQFLLVDDTGQPAGVVLATDIARILTRRRRW